MKNAIKREPCKLVCRWPSVSIFCNKKTIITALLALIMAPVGVEAKKKAKTVEVPQLVNYPSAEVSEYRLHGGEVFIRGRIVANDPQIIKSMEGRITAIMRDYIVRKEETTLFDIKADGAFSMKLHVPYPMFVLVYPLSEVYACPGDTIDVTMDTTKPSREEGIILDGTGVSGEVSRLINNIRTTYCDFPARDNIHEKGPDSLMTWRDVQVACLDDVTRQINAGLPELEGCSPLASDILRTYIISQHLEHICRYYMLTDMENIDRAAYWQQFFSFVAPREKYLLDNPLLMIAGNEFFFNYVEYTVMRPLYAGGVLEYIPFEYDPKIAETKLQGKHTFRREFRRNAMNELQDKLYLSPTDFSAQVCQLRNIFSSTKWNNDQYDVIADDFAATMAVITHPELIRRAVLTYRDFIKENEVKAIEQKPMTKGDSIFQRIVEPYKGNVLYIDFWEMSCGPCRATMLQMRDEVEANKDKPVKYLYITDDTPEKCRPFLEPNNIQGEHIHITPTEWGYLKEKFQFTGIPFVVLFDKNGNRRDDKTVEQLLEEMK